MFVFRFVFMFLQPMGFAAFYLRRLSPPRTSFKKRGLTKKQKLVLRANQSSYYGGNERARNLLSDAPENDFLVAN